MHTVQTLFNVKKKLQQSLFGSGSGSGSGSEGFGGELGMRDITIHGDWADGDTRDHSQTVITEGTTR